MKKILFILTLIVFTACAKELKEFETKEFVLNNLYNDYKITMSFEKGKIYGFSGVNRYFGTINLQEKNIKISNLAMTKMAGSPEAMRAEQEYLDLLVKSNKFEIIDETLIFYTENNKKLEFSLVKDK